VVANGRPVRVLTGLRERNQGRMQGMLADDVPGFAGRMANPADSLDGGETTFQLDARVRSALAVIRRAHRSGDVLVVAHFLTNQMLLKELLGLPVQQAMRINQSNDELYVVELVPGRAARVWKRLDRTRLGEF
jgi:broad specificity phosphatase PhoE